MEQMIVLISKVCVILVLILVSVVVEEYISFNKGIKSALGMGTPGGYGNEASYKKTSVMILTQIIQGALFAFLIYIDSTISFNGLSEPDIIYDAREVILNLSVIYGPITATITAIASIIARIMRNSYNSMVPVVCIMCTYIMEISYLYYLKKKGKKLRVVDFTVMAVVTGLISNIGIYLTIREDIKTAATSAFTLMFIYPLFSISVYRIIDAIKKSNNLVFELYKSDEKF